MPNEPTDSRARLNNSRALLLLSSAIICSTGVLPTSTARAWCQTTSHRTPANDPLVSCRLADNTTTFPLAWRRRCSAISISGVLPSSDMTRDEVVVLLRRSLDAWENVVCDGAPTPMQVEIIAEPDECTQATHQLNGPNTNSLMFVADGWVDQLLHDPNAFAVTTVWHSTKTGEIWGADMELNEARGNYAECPDTGCRGNSIDFRNVVTHELGHYFGMAHTTIGHELATMYYKAASDELIKRDLDPDDIEGFCAIYSPESLPDSCDITPQGGLNLCVPVPDDGCSVAAPAPQSGPGFGLVGLLSAVLGLSWYRRRRRV